MKKLVSLFLFAAMVSSAHAQSIVRTELKRADLTGKDMDIIVTVIEVPPVDGIARHVHPGEEAVYVLEGATLGLPDGKQISFPAGAVTVNTRDVPHAGFKVVGDKTLKMLTVHIVDKGKPVTDWVK
jgi:quercetin dioxygenase-like cupin family protein